MSVLGWADKVRRNEEKRIKEQLKLEKKEKLRQKELTEKLNSLNLYHFTDIRNLDSIRKNGLFGWLALENHMYYAKDVDYFPAVDENNVSRLCPCAGPCPHPLPTTNLITIGTVCLPLDI